MVRSRCVGFDKDVLVFREGRLIRFLHLLLRGQVGGNAAVTLRDKYGSR